jgi:hypothetical protein
MCILVQLKLSWVPVATPIIPATQEAEISRIEFRGQPQSIPHGTLSQKKKKITKKGLVVRLKWWRTCLATARP